MAQDGDYPFVVCVRNTFPKDSGWPNIVVYYHYHAYGMKGSTTNEWPRENIDHKIKPGESLCFSAHWSLDNLEITLDSWDGLGDYFIWCGTMALCRLVDTVNNESPPPTIPALEGTKEIVDEEGGSNKLYYIGGAWKSSDISPHWKLKIFKLVEDPEVENISVGVNPPT